MNLGAATGITVNLNGASNIADIGQVYQLLTLANGGAITPPPGGAATVLNNNDAAAPQPVWAYNAATDAVSAVAPAVAPIVAPGGGGAPVGGGVPVVVPNLNQNINIEITELNDNNSNAYVNYILDNGNIKAVSNVREGLKEDFSTTNPGIVEAFADIDISQDSDARDVVNELGILSTTDPLRQQDAANRLSVVTPAEALANLAIEVVQAAQSSISSRIDNISVGAYTNAISVSEAVGVAAGSEPDTERYGV